ncbi:hypothetical protein BV22DRAFT_1106485 [Leucogyrophana mollusca]|uniref:Uncharacterized protein n=1 Tax=Leucogyrophana mollusca TaxID=85980 RepID=A0ACB8BD40_9AGAM|nr:hypothetical protein BV22DRAFT_1106485 [Leucogyrophana mollusca]
MARFYDEIPEYLIEWIKKQHMFWVASAPLSPDGHINVSPKGTADCFHIIDSHRVWYEDLSGSGVETISHVRENRRITILFNAFEGPPRITRLFGIGTVHEFGTPEYQALIPAETRNPGSRAAIVIDVYHVGTSCGFAVPLYDFVGQRTQLLRILDRIECGARAPGAAKSTSAGMKGYWVENNLRSLDGLPGLVTAPDSTAPFANNFNRDTPRPTMKNVKPGASGATKISGNMSMHLLLGFFFYHHQTAMAKFYDEIPEYLIEWIKRQHMFWVASAPLDQNGHINVSPKGTTDCFHVVDSHRVWYEDLSGSGIETISHLRENGRITILFNAFEGPPRITRLWGFGTVHEFGTPEYHALIPAATRKPGSRAAIVIDVYQVGTSCGFAVPLYDFVAHRTQLLRSFDLKETCDRVTDAAASTERDEKGLRAYWVRKNLKSLDGLPGLLTAPDCKITPTSNFDRDAPRPMMKTTKPRGNGVANISGKTGLLIGFMIGAFVATAVPRIISSDISRFQFFQSTV